MQNAEIKKPQVQSTVKKKKRRASSLDRIKSRAGWVFIMPFVIGFILIYIPIIYDSIGFSFSEMTTGPTGGMVQTFVGFDNYAEALFDNADFVQVLTTGMTQLIFDIPAIVIFSLFMAIMLNQKMVGRAVFRVIFFIPVILSTGIIDRIDQGNQMLDYMQNTDSTIGTGATNQSASTAVQIVSAMDFRFLFNSMKAISPEMIAYVVSAVNNIYNIVNRSGVQLLIFLGGLQSISPAIYESAFMEGASAWETFWKITFPMISPMILVNAVYTVIDSFTSKSNRVMALIEQVYDEPGGNTLSSAMAWMYFLIVILMLALVGAIVSSFVFYQRREN